MFISYKDEFGVHVVMNVENIEICSGSQLGDPPDNMFVIQARGRGDTQQEIKQLSMLAVFKQQEIRHD